MDNKTLFIALVAVGIGALAVVGGLQLSLHEDTPAGPGIVAMAALIFAVSALLGRKAR